MWSQLQPTLEWKPVLLLCFKVTNKKVFVGPQLWLGEWSTPWRPSLPRSWKTPPGRTAHLPPPYGGCAPPQAPQTGCPQRGRRRRSVGRPWSPVQTLRTCTHTNTHNEKEMDGRRLGGLQPHVKKCKTQTEANVCCWAHKGKPAWISLRKQLGIYRSSSFMTISQTF